MKQVLQNLRSGQTTVGEAPRPTPQAGEVLVRTAASLVSAGTERMLVEFAEKSLLGKVRARPDLARQVLDKARREGVLPTLEASFNRLDQPMPLGYSSAGVIEGLGEGVQGFSVGQRVACAGGGFAVHAEWVGVPVNLIAPLPNQVDFESAAFATLGAIALHGFRLAHPQLGERVAVIGLGLLGLLAVQIAQAAGCQVFGVDLAPERVALAQQLGAQAVLRPAAIEAALAFSRGRGCDSVLICADTPSTDPVELAGAIARDRARVVAVGAVGLTLPRKIYYEKELSFINSRSYGPGRYDPLYEEGGLDYPIGYVRWTEGRNLEAIVDLLAAGRMDVRPLITHRFPISQAPAAYELITGRAHTPFLGVLLTYPDSQISGSTPADELMAPGFAGEATTEAHPTPTPAGEAPRQAENAFAAAAPAAPTLVAPAAPAVAARRSTAPIGIGVLGAGNFATAVMLPGLKAVPQLKLVGIASASGMSAQHAAQKFGFGYASSQAEQVIQDPQVDCVAILTRHNLHADQVLAALTAGKHVFCEKPLALTLEESHAVQSALANSPGLLMVGFNRRFAPLAVQLGRFFEARAEPLYAHYRVNAGYIPLTHWTHDLAQGGGRIIGEGCHFIDFLTYLVGTSPVEVTARGLPDRGRYREDNLSLTFTFSDGSLGVVDYFANGDKSFPKERVEVFGGGRAAALDDYRSLELAANGRRQVTHAYLRQDKGHQAEWRAFSAAMLNGGPAPIPYDQLFGVTRAAIAAVEALRTRTTVRI